MYKDTRWLCFAEAQRWAHKASKRVASSRHIWKESVHPEDKILMHLPQLTRGKCMSPQASLLVAVALSKLALLQLLAWTELVAVSLRTMVTSNDQY